MSQAASFIRSSHDQVMEPECCNDHGVMHCPDVYTKFAKATACHSLKQGEVKRLSTWFFKTFVTGQATGCLQATVTVVQLRCESLLT
jgi:hypothetical protein